MKEKDKMEEAETSESDVTQEGAGSLWRGFGPSIVQTPMPGLKQVKKIALGQSHALVLTEDGVVYGVGSNSHGQLGNGSSSENLEEPARVPALEGQLVIDVACGPRHSGAVTATGYVFMWGNNESGQCGAEEEMLSVPHRVQFPVTPDECVHRTQAKRPFVGVVQLSCGEAHTAALTDNHEVWVWGSGVALGILNTPRTTTPLRLDFLRGHYVVSVICGGYHTVALVSTTVSVPPDPDDSGEKDEATCQLCEKGSLCVNSDSAHVCPLGLPLETPPPIPLHESAIPLLRQLQRFRYGEQRRSVPDILSALASRNGEGRASSVPPSSRKNEASEKTEEKLEEKADVPHNHSTPDPNDVAPKVENGGNGSSQEIVSWEVVDAQTLPPAEETSKYPARLPVSAALKAKLLRSMSESAVGTKILTTARSFDFKKDTSDGKGDESTTSSGGGEDSGEMKDDAEKTSVVEDTETVGHAVEVRRTKSVGCNSPPLIDAQSAKEFLAQRLSSFASAMSPGANSGREPVFVYEATTEALRQNVNTLTNMVMSGVMNTADRFGFVSKQMNHEYDVSGVGFGSLDDAAELLQGLGLNGLEFLLDEMEAGVDEVGDEASDHLLSVDSGRKASVTRASSLKVEVKRKMSRSSRVASLDTSLSGVSVIALEPSPLKKRLAMDEKACIATEVWSWGKGNMGQLGQGDAMDRLQPCCVNVLRSRNVIKVAAGQSHTVALTAGGQVYAWGYNSHGQLGNAEHSMPSYSPQQIKLEMSALVWDVAAGSKHTVLLADRGVQTEIYYCGKQEGPLPDSDGPVALSGAIGTTQPVMVSVMRENHVARQVFAGGFLCGCISDHTASPHLTTVRELAASERCFYQTLTLLRDTVLDPLTKDATYVTLSSSSFGGPFQDLLTAFRRLWEQVACNNLSLGAVLQMPAQSVSVASLIDRLDQWVSAFEVYTYAYFDLYAINTLSYCAKTASSFFSKTQPFKQELASSKAPEEKAATEVLARLLEEPIRRMGEYHKTLDILAEQYKQMSVSNFREVAASKRWGQLVTMAGLEKKAAERTRAFWESCPQKLAESVRNANRRLVRESKSHPLSLPGSGRFSSNWFVLLSDVLVLSQFSGHTVYSLPLVWVDPLPDTDVLQNAFTITMPEDALTLQCPTPQEKTEWICALNQAIRASLTRGVSLAMASGHIGRLAILGLSHQRLSPPLTRTATHTFTKKIQLKDATYMGTWLCGKLHGHGELLWPDGRKYTGRFKQNIQCGDGLYVSPSTEGNTISEGVWKDGKMNGLGSIRYPNGDLYEGFFKDGLCHGHGILKKGQFMSSAASIYIGEWALGHRSGYGVMDDIVTGEKYMGMWQDDCRHGTGMVVTLDGVYYEGNFAQNKMTGQGLMMFEDGSWYEGEFGGSGGFGGKGTLTLSSGDKVEGSFYGLWNEGVKISGTLWKTSSGSSHTSYQEPPVLPSLFGKLCVPAEKKWSDIFEHCRDLLGVSDPAEPVNSQRIWETVAVIITEWRKKLTHDSNRVYGSMEDLDGLDKIPQFHKGKLTLEDYRQIQTYLMKAFESSFHPLGKLMEGLVDVYRATYIGVGAHPRLLTHAVEEVRSFISRIYTIVRFLFPDLPDDGQEHRVRPAAISVSSSSSSSFAEESDDDDDGESEVVTASGLILPALLPRIYPPLFTLYALHNEKEDNSYWETLLKWNKQSDLALMAYLGVDHKFWFTVEDERTQSDPFKNLSSLKDQHFSEAVDALQQLSTTFSPTEKLCVIHKTFQAINKEVQASLGEEYVWTMDDLFPVFQYVVVRARIRHLGSEVLMIEDLMENHLQHGELGIMFTTLKACYFQVKKEQLTST